MNTIEYGNLIEGYMYFCNETHNHKNTVQKHRTVKIKRLWFFFSKVGTNNRNEEAFYSSTKTSKVWEFVKKRSRTRATMYT